MCLGLGLVTYGSFAVAIGTVLVVLALTRQFRALIAVAVMSALPAVLWWAYVTATTGQFFSPETTDFRQFVWVIDGLQDGTLVSLAIKNTGWFLVSFADAQTFLALFLIAVSVGVLAAVTLLRAPNASSATESGEALGLGMRAIGILLPVQIAFIWLMGFYQTRLSWGILATAIVALGMIAALAVPRFDARLARWVNVGGLVLALAWYATWVAIPGPWH